MGATYSILVDRYLDFKGEYEVLSEVFNSFGINVLACVTDIKGNNIISGDINADFKYTTDYEEQEDGTVTTYVNVSGFTLKIQVDADLASEVSYKIHEKSDWYTIRDSYFDFVYHLDDGSKSTKCELDIIFDFEDIEKGLKNRDIQSMVSKDLSNITSIIYKADEGIKNE